MVEGKVSYFSVLINAYRFPGRSTRGSSPNWIPYPVGGQAGWREVMYCHWPYEWTRSALVYRHTIDATTYTFADLRDLLAKATPPRSGDRLAGIAAGRAEQMIAARMALADVRSGIPGEAVIPYEGDEVTRLIIDSHDARAFAPVASLTVGEFRDWLLSDAATPRRLAALAPGITPEMAAAVSKLMRNQDLILVAGNARSSRPFATRSVCRAG